jgi:hypothetical protein
MNAIHVFAPILLAGAPPQTSCAEWSAWNQYGSLPIAYARRLCRASERGRIIVQMRWRNLDRQHEVWFNYDAYSVHPGTCRTVNRSADLNAAHPNRHALSNTAGLVSGAWTLNPGQESYKLDEDYVPEARYAGRIWVCVTFFRSSAMAEAEAARQRADRARTEQAPAEREAAERAALARAEAQRQAALHAERQRQADAAMGRQRRGGEQSSAATAAGAADRPSASSTSPEADRVLAAGTREAQQAATRARNNAELLSAISDELGGRSASTRPSTDRVQGALQKTTDDMADVARQRGDTALANRLEADRDRQEAQAEEAEAAAELIMTAAPVITEAVSGLFNAISEGKARREAASARALAPLVAACSAGGYTECRELGIIYEDGMEVDYNPTRSKEYFSRGWDLADSACHKGDVRGCLLNIESHFEGFGRKRSVKNGLEYLEAKCNGGVGVACAAAAMIYEAGRKPVRADPTRARLLREKAAALRHP